MEANVTNFSVASRGYCFLCLNKTSLKIPPFKMDNIAHTSISIYSLQDVSRYLKIDMRKVFIEGGPVPPHLLAKVEKSRLTVELCEECGSLTDNISKPCRQLEKLKLEIESGLESIHRKMLEADETGRTEQFRGVVDSELDSGLGGGIEIMEAFRLETMQKCSRKIGAASPRLPIQKLTSEEIPTRTFRIPKKDAETCSEGMSASVPSLNSITMEKPNNENWTLEDNSHTEVSMMDDLDPEVGASIPAIVKVEGSEIRLMRKTKVDALQMGESRATANNPKRRWSINPETGKFKCTLCEMEYGSRGPAFKHYNTVHLKIRFKCKICGKEFTQEFNYKIHHQSVHLGIRFQCRVCEKTFAGKRSLMKHQRKAGCAIKIDQNI